MTVETTHGKTSGSVERYAEADPRFMVIFEQFKKGKVDDRQVYSAVRKISGMHRLEEDWKKALAGKGLSGIAKYEAWLAEQPELYKRVYGSAEVISAIIIKQAKESV